MNCISRYGARYIVAYVLVIELYLAWFMTMAFSDYYSLLILLINAFILCIILNDNVPFLHIALRRNWSCYIYSMYWFYGHDSMRYTYERLPLSGILAYDAPILAENSDSDILYFAGITYIEKLLYEQDS